MIKAKLAIASMFLILAPIANVSAGTVNDDFTTTLQVNAFCSITAPAADIYYHHNSPAYSYNGGGATELGVTCNRELPYTLEVDSDANGAVVLTDDATSKTLPGTLRITSKNVINFVPWGQIANGNALTAIATGGQDEYWISFGFNIGRQPAGGVYNKLNTITLTF